MDINPLQQRLQHIQTQIRQACQQAGRTMDDVTLVAVSKRQPWQKIAFLAEQGLSHFGESYLDEALEKQQQLNTHPLIWHFIGPIQSNKTRGIAENFDWVHSVDRLKIAQRLSAQRPEYLPSLNILLQINISGESSKSGLLAEQVTELMTAVTQLPRLRLRGLMAIPAPHQSITQQRQTLAALRQLWVSCQHQGFTLDQLSVGMSDDFELAIGYGSTMVRIGTALMGVREE